MTDTMFTRTALTEAAKTAGVTYDQACTILEAAGVKVEPEKPALPTEPGSDIIATEVRGVTGKWRMFLDSDLDWVSPEKIDGHYWHRPECITVWTETVVVPAGEKIDPNDVREGDLVRVKLKNGDEATFTVRSVGARCLRSWENIYEVSGIRTIHLLDREGEG